MSLNDLNLNLLRHLDALLEERSVSRAAERVHISQSAMSLALARLRDYFQDDILRKIGRTMVPTSLALSLGRPVRNILTELQSITSPITFDPSTSDRKFTITGSDFTMDVILKKLLPKLAQIAPRVRLSYVGLAHGRREDFEQGRIDLMIAPDISTIEGHPSELLLTAGFTCVCWSRNTLVRNKLSLEQYQQLSHVCVRLEDKRVLTHDEWFVRRYEIARKIEVEVPYFGLAVQLITGTQRIATCHLQHAKMHARQYSLRLVEPPFEIPPSRLFVQWHKQMDRDPALTWFRTFLKESVTTI